MISTASTPQPCRFSWEGLAVSVVEHKERLSQAQEKDIAVRAEAIARDRTQLVPKSRQDRERFPIRSIAMRQVVESCLRQFGRFLELARLGNLSRVPLGACQLFLTVRASVGLSYQQLKKDRRALCIAFGEELEPVSALPRAAKPPRELSELQVCIIASAQTSLKALATHIAYAAGLRAVELLTLARIEDQPPSDREWHERLHLGLVDWVPFSVKGKGGLVRVVMLPRDLANELETLRRPHPEVVSDRGRHVTSYYYLPGGDAWAASFRRAAIQMYGESCGGHGVRHGYVAARRLVLSQLGVPEEEIYAILSQELGHFRVDIVKEYYTRGPWKPVGGPTFH